MKINESTEKNDLLLHDININKNALTYKLFSYFYSLFLINKEFKSFIIGILIIIETIQFISYAFTPPHYYSWKISQNKIELISNIIGAFRISTLMKFIEYKIYSFILYFFIIIIFILVLIVILHILFGESSSKLYNYSIKIIQPMINIISIVFYIPITEIILIPVNCVNNKVYGVKNGETCWKNIHYLMLL